MSERASLDQRCINTIRFLAARLAAAEVMEAGQAQRRGARHGFIRKAQLKGRQGE